MIIKTAKHSGYCFGVKNAVNLAYSTIENNSKKNIYSCGPIIHNDNVTEEMKQKGLIIANSINDVPEKSIIIIRSHGEGRNFYVKAQEKNLEILDATCPFVSKIHKLVYNEPKNDEQVLIIGDCDHPEVKGILGWCKNNAITIDSLEEAEKITNQRLFIVVQTTFKENLFNDIITILQNNDNTLIINKTICNATENRQNSTSDLASNVDFMVIIGDRKSSNTRKLYEISKERNKNTIFVENKSDLSLKDIVKCNKIGVSAGASTPERIIKEVISTMSEAITENTERNEMHDLMDEIEKALRLPKAGEIVNGSVILVNEREVVVNLGCKKDGILPIAEVAMEENQKLTDLFKEGDEVQAKVLKTDDGDGNILLSKRKLVVNEHWDEITAAYDEKVYIEVKVQREVKGGVIAVYKEVSGFIPLSQLSDKYVENADDFLGKNLTVKVTRVDQRRNKAVFSHKAYLAEEKSKKLKEIWDSLNVGDTVPGTVMRFTDYGAFVDIGGIDGLLHISEISWGKLKHPQEALTIGEEINVKILSMNEEKGKISLGLKQNKPEPWSVIDENYQVNQVISGTVVQIKEYGAFIELEPGLDGLVHISEINHNRVNNIADELSIGQTVSAKILEIDKERKRISLSIKETLEVEVIEDNTEDEATSFDTSNTTTNDDEVKEPEIPAVEEAVDTEPAEAEETVSEAETVVEEENSAE